MVEGRAKQVLATLLQKRPQVWRSGIEVVATDGLSGFKSSSTKEIPETVPAMDSRSSARPGTHWMCALRRVQQTTFRRRGNSNGTAPAFIDSLTCPRF